MANELIGGNAWLVARLTGDAELSGVIGSRVFADFAAEADPSNPTNKKPTPYPLVVFHVVSSRDINKGDANRVMVEILYQVRIIGRGGYRSVSESANRLDALLHRAPADVVTHGSQTFDVLGCYRERGLMDSDLENGVRFSWIGGRYRVLIQARS